MSMQPDDLGVAGHVHGPSCGEIVMLPGHLRLTNIACDQTCVTGAQPVAIAGGGRARAVRRQNCLSLDGGVAGGNGIAIFTCLFKQCPSQVAMCPTSSAAGQCRSLKQNA